VNEALPAGSSVGNAAELRTTPYQPGDHLLPKLAAMRRAFRNWMLVSALRKLATWRVPAVLDRRLLLRTREGPRLLARTRDFEAAIDVYAFGAYDFLYDWQSFQYVIDVGAQIGCFSLWLAHRSNARIHAFEPNPETYAILAGNLLENSLQDQVTPNRLGLAAAAGHRNLHLSRLSSASSLVTEVDGDRVVGVDTVGLAELIAATGFPRVDLLKIDIEGSEYEVFDAVQPDTLDGVEMIFMECHPVPGRSPSELIGRLQSLGFDVAAEAFVRQSFLVAARPQ